MYLCYVDETGMDEDSEVVVTVGILVEATNRLVKTNNEWSDRLQGLLGQAGAGVAELKSSKLYNGGGKWRNLEGDRHDYIEELVDWFVDRKHRVALAAIEKSQPIPDVLDGMTSHELLAAFHVALQVQRAHTKMKANKGATFFVMDESKISGKFVALVTDPPAWSDDYYKRGKKAAPLDQLVHTPFYVRSEHFALVQLADLIAFIYRQYVNVARNGPNFEGELKRLERWKAKLDGCLLDKSHRRPRGGGAGAKAIAAATCAELIP